MLKKIKIEFYKKKNLFLFFRNLLEHFFKMIIKFCNIHLRIFKNTANNNVSFFSINYFNERGFNFITQSVVYMKGDYKYTEGSTT